MRGGFMARALRRGTAVHALARSRVLVGRAGELQHLVAAVCDAPVVVVVEGEAGIGKTRLVEELIASPALAGMAVAVGVCSPTVPPFPLGAVVEALPTLRAHVPTRSLNPVAGTLRHLCPELVDV